MATTPAKTAMHFKSVVQADVPQGRHGKHNEIVAVILGDLNRLQDGAALKIPLDQLPDRKENIRSALNRAARKGRRKIATATDADHLYIWNATD
jgi:hypothetical protein